MTIAGMEPAPGSVDLGLRECHALAVAFDRCPADVMTALGYKHGDQLVDHARAQLVLTERLMFPAVWPVRVVYRTVAAVGIRMFHRNRLVCVFCGRRLEQHIPDLRSAVAALRPLRKHPVTFDIPF